jgi:hypothetical protein
MAQADDVLLRPRVDGPEGGVDLARIAFVHRHRHPQTPLLSADRAQYFETAQVCADQEDTLAVGQRRIDDLLVVYADVEQVEPIVDEEHTVMHHRRKTHEMPEQVAPADGRCRG